MIPTKDSDVGAGQAIFEAAAGAVKQSDTGESLRNNKENLLNPPFVCASSEPFGEIHLARG